MKTVSLSLKSLYDIFGTKLENGEIIKSVDGDNEYYDLHTVNGLVCMDGETCEVLEEDEDNFVLKAVDEDDHPFVLTREEIDIAVFK